MTDKEKVQRLKPFRPHKYESVDLDHLIIYAVGILEKIGADISFENAVVAAFKLFPKKFSLPGFSAYPDGKRVHDCLFRCTYKTKKWLGGKTRQGFTITDRTRIFIKEAEELLSMGPLSKTTAHSQTRRKELLIAELERSPAYAKYLKQEFDSISEADLCYLLQGTLDSLRETLRENFLVLKKFAGELKREDVLRFLARLEERFKYFLYNR